jgi:hypothetical protein
MIMPNMVRAERILFTTSALRAILMLAIRVVMISPPPPPCPLPAGEREGVRGLLCPKRLS